jgi:ketosteroid isomerase-like protein
LTDALDTVRRYLEAFWESDWPTLRSLLAPDAVYVDPLLPDPVTGVDAIVDVLAYCHAWGTYRGEIVGIFGGGRLVCVELRIQGTVTAPPEGMSSAVVGRTFDFAEADVFELDAGGRIVRQSIYADALGLERRLGESFFP